MPNNINDPLFLLIKSLTGAEKRHFKLYISRNQANEEAKFVKLFDVLEAFKEYNEEQILKKCPSIARQQLPNIKAHLYGELLTALRLLHSVKNMEIQIREQIDFAKILYNRGLILQALKILDKAKNLAKSNSHYILTLEILQFEKDIEARHITRSLKGRAGELIGQTDFTLKQINEVTHLSNVALKMYELYLENGHVTNEIHSAEIAAIFKKNIEGINEDQISFFGKVYLHQCFCWYYIIQLDFTKYYRHAEKWVQLFSEHAEAKKEDPFLYVKAVHNLLNALFIIGRHKKMNEELFHLEEFYEIAGAFNENLKIQAFVYLYTAKINKHFLEGTFTEGLELVNTIEEKLNQYQQYIDTHRVLVFYYKIASLYFGSGDNDNAIIYLNKIINLKVGQLRTDIQCFARLLHLIAHYELGNMELVEYLIKSVYRFLSKMENLDAVLTEIFAFLRSSLTSKQRDVKKSFVQLRDKLATVSTSKYNRRSYQYLDIVSWLESKIEGVPVQTIIKEKFKKATIT
jgi:tetratricopeptide (TPR) repeat protein